MSIFPMLFFFLSERCHKPCTVLLRSGPRARSCQKIIFKILHRQASIFPVFNFSRFQFFPFSIFPVFKVSFSRFLLVKIIIIKGVLTSIVLLGWNSLRCPTCSRMSSLLLAQFEALRHTRLSGQAKTAILRKYTHRDFTRYRCACRTSPFPSMDDFVINLLESMHSTCVFLCKTNGKKSRNGENWTCSENRIEKRKRTILTKACKA